MEAVTEQAEQTAVRIVGLLVIVAFASSVALWTIDTSLASGESLFAVYLSIDLISFAMISYVYRVTKTGDSIGRIPILAGCTLLVLLIFVGFAI
jgi:hypothetical protein